MKNHIVKGNIFLYRRVQSHLEKLVRKRVLKPEKKIPGERVLAKELNVSRDTIRTALRALEEDGFLVRIPAKGTFIRSTPVKNNINIAFVFPEPELSLLYQGYDNFVTNSTLWRGIVAAGAQHNAAISFQVARPYADKTEAEVLAQHLTDSYAGVIFPSEEFDASARILIDAGFPCVFCNQSMFPHVYYDRAQAMTLATGHIRDNGCRSIMLLGRGSKNSFSWNQKIAAFKEDFAKRGMTIPDENIILLPDSSEKIFHRMLNIFDRRTDLPDAIFCANPTISLTLLHIAQKNNWQIPEKIQLLGYANDMDLQRTIPMLTHIKLPHAEIGAKAVELLIAKIRDNQEIPQKTILKASLIQGETTRNVCGEKINFENFQL